MKNYGKINQKSKVSVLYIFVDVVVHVVQEKNDIILFVVVF